jgi:hypothetical protein
MLLEHRKIGKKKKEKAEKPFSPWTKIGVKHGGETKGKSGY